MVDNAYRQCIVHGEVKREVGRRPALAVPMWLRNAPTSLMRDAGYGDGYRYAHDEAGAVADMDCLPEELVDTTFYRPSEQGWETRIRERLREIAQRRGARD